MLYHFLTDFLMIIAGLLMTIGNTQLSTLHTDHLNSVQFIEDLRSKVGQENKLRTMNGCSYYWWIVDLVTQTHTSVVHIKSHTDNTGIVSGSMQKQITMHQAHRKQHISNQQHLSRPSQWKITHFTVTQMVGSNQT